MTHIKFFIISILFLSLAVSQKGITKVEKKPDAKKIEQKDSQNVVKPMKKKNMKKINEFQAKKISYEKRLRLKSWLFTNIIPKKLNG